jgi:hypothetical protein
MKKMDRKEGRRLTGRRHKKDGHKGREKLKRSRTCKLLTGKRGRGGQEEDMTRLDRQEARTIWA